MDELSTPWELDGALVEHPTFGQGRLMAEPNSAWIQFIPTGSGPMVAIPLSRALSIARVVTPEEMTVDKLEDFDWEAARWSPMADADRALADEMAELVVDRLFAVGGLDKRWRREALSQVRLDLGHTPKSGQILRVLPPLGAGEYLYEWDGTAAAARAAASETGEIAGRTIIVGRAGGSPCGWEPSNPPRSRRH